MSNMRRKMTRSVMLMVITLLFVGNGYADGILKDDAFTQSGTPNQNFGTNANLRVASGVNSHLTFDLSSLPPGTSANDVSKATLRLWVNTVTTSGSFDIRRITGVWNESTLTSNTAPSLGSVEISAITITAQDVDSFVTIDLTPLVKDWINGIVPNNGLAIVANAVNTNIRFDSKENGQTSHEPRLEIRLKGPKGLNWKGAWNATTNYVADDAVSFNGSSWTAKQSNINSTPVEGADWTIVAQKGDTGATGATGAMGPQGSTGAVGPQGPPGPNGAQGPVGPVGPSGPPGFSGPIQVDTFTASGTWTMPAGTNRVFVVAVGGGGGGGSSGCAPCGGGGGGGGGYAQKWITSGLTTTVEVTVGEGGLGLSGVAGRSGGTSSFGPFLSATGGGGGEFGPQGGSAGTGIGGDLNLTGRAGQDGGPSITAAGGDPPLGYGFGGLARPKTPGPGNPGLNYGAGGGGCLSSSFEPGGSGTGGLVIIWSYP